MKLTVTKAGWEGSARPRHILGEVAHTESPRKTNPLPAPGSRIAAGTVSSRLHGYGANANVGRELIIER